MGLRLSRLRVPVVMLVPAIFAIVWGFLAYNVVVLGRLSSFSGFILPLAMVLLAAYISGTYLLYRIEATGHMARLEDLEMEINSVRSRIDMVEALAREKEG